MRWIFTKFPIFQLSYFQEIEHFGFCHRLFCNISSSKYNISGGEHPDVCSWLAFFARKTLHVEQFFHAENLESCSSESAPSVRLLLLIQFQQVQGMFMISSSAYFFFGFSLFLFLFVFSSKKKTNKNTKFRKK